MHSTIVSLVITLLTAVTLQAAQLHVLAWNQSISKRDLAIATGTKESKSEPVLGMHHLARSQPIKISLKAENLHIQVNDRSSAEGTPLTIPLNIPENITRPLILIIPDKESPAGIKPIIIDDSAANFKWGTFRFINVTSEALVFRYDKKNILVATGWKPVDVLPGGKGRNIAASFYLRKNLKSPPLYSSIWKHQDNLRQLVLIVPSKDKSRSLLDFKFITENRAVVEAPKPQTP
ncbi:MAG: hypothetical protein ACSHX6_16520 [Akkermansiaceae bacterium]